MSKLSIIMPVYNVEKFLKRSVDSIINQTFTDWELILVDDGSTDNSGKICDKFAETDNRIKVFHKENGGAGSARNKGLFEATGDFVAFPDSDDWIEPAAYEKCLKIMEKENIDLLLFGSINTVYDKNGGITSEQFGKTADIVYKTQSECRKNWINLVTTLPMDGPSNKMYRMSVIKNNNISFPDIRRMQDGVFNMRFFACVNSFASITDYFYHFTMHSSDYQKKKIPKSFIECASTYHKTAIDMLKGWGLCDKESEGKLGSWFSETVISAQLEYLPQGESNGFIGRYRHIKSISNDKYVRDFYNNYQKLKKLNKKELAVYYKLNLLLAIYSYKITK